MLFVSLFLLAGRFVSVIGAVTSQSERKFAVNVGSSINLGCVTDVQNIEIRWNYQISITDVPTALCQGVANVNRSSVKCSKRTVERGVESTLTISRAQRSDAGLYTCVEVNSTVNKIQFYVTVTGINKPFEIKRNTVPRTATQASTSSAASGSGPGVLYSVVRDPEERWREKVKALNESAAGCSSFPEVYDDNRSGSQSPTNRGATRFNNVNVAYDVAQSSVATLPSSRENEYTAYASLPDDI